MVAPLHLEFWPLCGTCGRAREGGIVVGVSMAAAQQVTLDLV